MISDLSVISKFKKYTSSSLIIALVCFLNVDIALSASFYQTQKRGWFWFEEKQEPKNINPEITPEEASREIEAFKQKLQDATNVWLINPTLENTKSLMLIEAEMFKRTERAAKMRQLVTLISPNLDDNLTNPSNVQAIRFNKDKENAIKQNTIKDFAKTFDLVLFIQDGCNVCTEFEPVLKVFADTYLFKVEAVSLNSKSKYFKTISSRTLIDRLKVRGTPTVFVVHKSKPIYFELISNYASITELEERVLLAGDYIEMFDNQNKSYK